MRQDEEQFDAHQYTIDGGWDFSHIEATARLGVADEDLRQLRATYGPGPGERCAQRLVDYCRERYREVHS